MGLKALDGVCLPCPVQDHLLAQLPSLFQDIDSLRSIAAAYRSPDSSSQSSSGTHQSYHIALSHRASRAQL